MTPEIRTLADDDLDAYLRLRRSTFSYGDAGDDASAARFRPRLPMTRGAFVDGRLASTATVFPFAMHHAGREVAVGGLAAVQTPPEHRRRGLVRALLADALERLHEGGVGWCLEYPFDPRFYARYGWQSVPNGAQLAFPPNRLLTREVVEAERIDPDALASLEPVYRAWAAGHHFTLVRDGAAREPWRRLVRSPWESVDRLVYRLEDAYCILGYEHEGGRQVLQVEDYAWATPAGRARLLAFWGRFTGQQDAIHVRLAGDDPLVYDLARYAKPASELQARVADVAAALAPLAVAEGAPEGAQETELVLAVRDAFCPWNDGRFAVRLSPAGAEVAPATRSPDLSLDVRALALLLANAQPPASLARAGLLEGDLGAAGRLAAAVAGRAPFMPPSDYF